MLNNFIKSIHALPLGRIGKKIIQLSLEHVEEEPVYAKPGFLIYYSNRGLSREIRKQVVTGEYESEEFAVYKTLLKPGDIVIDVGANEGYVSLLFAKTVTASGRVLAIEPDRRNVGRFKRNVELNGLANIKIYELAAGKEETKAAFHYQSHQGADLGGEAWGSLIKHPMSDADQSTTIAVTRLDSLLSGLEKVDLIKIDTEGNEFDVICGAEGIINRMKPVISFEVNLSIWANMEKAVSEVFGYLRERRYQFFLPQNGKWIPFKWLNARVMNIFAVHDAGIDSLKARGLFQK